MRHANAIVRPPGPGFAGGITSSTQGPPDLNRALEQHDRYCQALRRCGLTLTQLPAEPDYPDGTFVEDTAVLIRDTAIITLPGAASRRGEVPSVRDVLQKFFPNLHQILDPGTLDGGDICVAEEHVFIGISARTNEQGAEQLARIVQKRGLTTTLVDIRGSTTLLHLKSGVTYLGNRQLLLSADAPRVSEFEKYELVTLAPEESYAANCLPVNDRVLMAAGHPGLASALSQRGYTVQELEMSEFRKMDGGLTCLSLRF